MYTKCNGGMPSILAIQHFILLPVQHWSKRGLFDRNKSLWGGWFIKTNELALYHAGDTGYSNDFKTTYERLGAPDYSFIPIGAYDPRWFMKDSHVNPEEAVQIALDLQTPILLVCIGVLLP
jgi:L-ascorbate metabolism protein UlaG (beta-lactamase superfamily)